LKHGRGDRSQRRNHKPRPEQLIGAYNGHTANLTATRVTP
jgi:hypothetical protein